MKFRLKVMWCAAITVWLITLSAAAFAQGEPVTIEFASWVEQRDQAVIEAFEKSHPNIKVEFRDLFGGDKLMVELAAGTGPDVMGISWAFIGDFVRSGRLINLDPYIERDSAEVQVDDLFAPTLLPGRWQGSQYAVPEVVGAQSLYFNNDIWSKAGLAVPGADWSWEDFSENGARLTQDTNGDGAYEQYGFASPGNWAFWMNTIYTQGGRMWDESYTKLTFDSPETRKALGMLARMMNELHVGPQNGNIAFQEGTTGMAMLSAPWVDRLKNRYSVSFDWQVHTNPLGPAGRALMGGVHQLAINVASEHKEAAWEFVKFYMSTEAQTIVNQFGNPPTRQSAVSAIEDPNARTFAAQMGSHFQYTNRLHSDIMKITGPAMSQLYTGEVSPIETATRIDQQIAALLKK